MEDEEALAFFSRRCLSGAEGVVLNTSIGQLPQEKGGFFYVCAGFKCFNKALLSDPIGREIVINQIN